MEALAGPAVLAAVVSLFVSAALRWSEKYHGTFSTDSQFELPQKFDSRRLPRIGGIALLAGMLAGMAVVVWWPESWVAIGAEGKGTSSWRFFARSIEPSSRPPFGEVVFGALLLGLLPVFAAGLAEDLTKRVRPAHRLMWVTVGAVAIVVTLELGLRSIHLQLIDRALANYPVSLAVTVFCCVGAANAFNIVDGLDGLLAGVSLITFAAIALAAWQVGDSGVFSLALILAGSVAGWTPFNWPRARLFAGDGGAYLLGFVSAALLLLLIARNREVSPWFGIAAAILPIGETLFSMWRRFVRGANAMEPDQLHLHQLVRWRLSQFVNWLAEKDPPSEGITTNGKREGSRVRLVNGIASPWLWAIHGGVALPASLFCRSTAVQLLLLSIFVVGYLLLYYRLLRARFEGSDMTMERMLSKIAGKG